MGAMMNFVACEFLLSRVNRIASEVVSVNPNWWRWRSSSKCHEFFFASFSVRFFSSIPFYFVTVFRFCFSLPCYMLLFCDCFMLEFCLKLFEKLLVHFCWQVVVSRGTSEFLFRSEWWEDDEFLLKSGCELLLKSCEFVMNEWERWSFPEWKGDESKNLKNELKVENGEFLFIYASEKSVRVSVENCWISV